MDAELRHRLDVITALLAVTAAGVLGIALVEGAIGAAATIFVVGGLIIAFIRRSGQGRALGPESPGE